MLRQALKLASSIHGVTRLCGFWTGVRYAGAVLRTLPRVLRGRSLMPADTAMRGETMVHYRGVQIQVPFSRIDEANKIVGDTPTFASIREIFGEDVYLRGFRQIGTVKTFVDLGANRGFVSILAARALGAEKIVGVEAQPEYSAMFEVLAEANSLLEAQRARVVSFAGERNQPSTITVGTACAEHGITEIDFLKCDIEGGENDVVLGDGAFLGYTRLIAMELHPEHGTKSVEIVSKLRAHGFAVAVADAQGGPSQPETATYLYASRDAANLAGDPLR
jgi:23S rRNA U2552 (ribose-2'-O)-methylase RlmE/FtsJ